MNLILRIIFWQLEAKCFRKSYLIKTHMKSSHSSSLVLSGRSSLQSEYPTYWTKLHVIVTVDTGSEDKQKFN